MRQRHKTVVYLRSDAVGTQECVNLECKVKCRAVGWHCDDVTLRSKHKYLRRKQVELDGIEEVHRVRLRVVENLLDSLQPSVQFVLRYALRIHRVAVILIFPVSGKTLFCDVIHVGRAYLHLYPLALLTHQRHMESLITVGLRVRQPVAQTLRMRFVHAADGNIYAEAVIEFIFAGLGLIDDADGKNVVYLIKGNILFLHLVPDGERTLYAGLDFVFDAHLVELLADGSRKLLEECLALCIGMFEVFLYFGIFLRILIMKGKVFKFGLYGVKSQPVGKGSIEIQCLAGNLMAFFFFLAVQMTHIVKAVAYLQ